MHWTHHAEDVVPANFTSGTPCICNSVTEHPEWKGQSPVPGPAQDIPITPPCAWEHCGNALGVLGAWAVSHPLWHSTPKLFHCADSKVLLIMVFLRPIEEKNTLTEELLGKPEPTRDLGLTVLWTDKTSDWQLRSQGLPGQAPQTCKKIIHKTTASNHDYEVRDQLLRGEAGLRSTQNAYTRISKTHSKSF